MDKICGIYKITNPSGKIYIGQSIDILRRKKQYEKLYYSTNQPALHNSILKYGWNNHIFEIIEECEFLKLNIKERYWQDFYNVLGKNGLNCLLTKTDKLPGVKSEESKIKKSITSKNKPTIRSNKIVVLNTSTNEKIIYDCLSQVCSYFNIKNIDIYQKHKFTTRNKIYKIYYLKDEDFVLKYKRKSVSKETREKLSKIHKGVKKNKEHSERMSKLHKGKKISREAKLNHSNRRRVICIEDDIIFEFITEAAIYYNVSISSIANNLSGLSKKLRINKTFKYV